VARWRVVTGLILLALLIAIGARLAPVYFRNLELQRYVADLTQNPENQTVPDPALRTRILERAQDLELPVTADNVQIHRGSDGLRIEVIYKVRVNLAFYTVDLHFYPGAGSR
jgi:hypothetical protein